MKVLFEGYNYPASEIAAFIPRSYCEIAGEYLRPKVVGYHSDLANNTSLLILPKVFLNESDLFFAEDIDPALFYKDDFITLISDVQKRTEIANFLFECSSWFYFSIKKYHNKFPASLSPTTDQLNIIDCSQSGDFNTELDIVIAFLKFNKENRDFLILKNKINQSQNNKINWSRSIRKGNAILDDSGLPIFLKTLSKKKEADEDEKLLIIYFTILKELEKKYNLKVYHNPFFKVLSTQEYGRIKRRGKYFLKQIKYKYFSEKMLKIYNLVFAYLERADESKIKKQQEEFLIIRDYNLVFQDMVDELLSDASIDKGLRKHKDDKELDHIYKDQSFFEDDEIYFIGDSKYYKAGNLIENKSIYKQYTYAKNVIQHNIDIFNRHDSYPYKLKYRDYLTEGYNITPNFFIKGVVENINFHAPELTIDASRDLSELKNKHFNGRLFDRDTLIVQSYSINFLFVLWSYINSGSVSSERFKKAARLLFKSNLLEYFYYSYNFFRISPEASVNDFIKDNFYKLNGMIYRPQKFEDTNDLIFALEKDIDVEWYLSEFVTGNFEISEYQIS